MTIKKFASAFIFVILTVWLAGCAGLAPWERGRLAKRQMALEAYPMQKLTRSHAYSSREAAAGVGSAEGGGCGCY